MSTISEWNSSNTSFYRCHGRQASLLLHPVGLEMLKFYAKLKKKGLDDLVGLPLAESLANGLQSVVRQRETEISSCLIDVIGKEWCHSHEDNSSVWGGSGEAMDGILSQSQASGIPDGVVRMALPYGQKKNQKQVQLIIEVSVDKNGGEKKMGQAFDYGSLLKSQSKTVLLFTFHVNRNKSKSNSDHDDLKITQEASIYLHSESEKERKMGFLWREVYEQHDANDLEFLKNSCEGVVRCLECAGHNQDAEVICLNIEYPSKWEVVSDNAAICEDKYVFKVFDNRLHPTYRRPDHWLNKQWPWIAKLEVETEFKFEESSNVESLGRPDTLNTANRKRARDSESPTFLSHTAYPMGSVLVVKYKHVKGTHFASRVSHFQDIAVCISEMHDENIVHGDIRGFNILHPYPPADSQEHEGGISKSLLIDFDLSGRPGKDQYPPCYSINVKDNAFDRSGAAGEIMQQVDD